MARVAQDIRPGCADHSHNIEPGEQDRYYGKVRTIGGWFRELFMVTGPEADARRARALPLIGQDPTRVPDLLFSGPEIPVAPDSRVRFFGEDKAAACVST